MVASENPSSALPTLPADVTLEVQRVLDVVGEGTSVFMTGSLVEGFGNEHSDVDLYLVLDAGRPEQATAIGMRRSRYVDCEYFAAGTLQRLAARMSTLDWPDIAKLREAEIDRYYRLAAGAPLRLTPEFAPIFACFSKQAACGAVAKNARRRACELFGCAAILAAYGDTRGADLTLRQAAVWLATAELAAEGEGYPALKWFGQKAARRYGRGTPKFDELVSECLRPSAELPQRLARLRERLVVPAGLAELLDARACAVAPGVRVLPTGHDFLLVHESLGVASASGPLSATLASLAQGLSWQQTTETLSRELGVPCREVRAGLWSEAAGLRSTGHLVEVRST